MRKALRLLLDIGSGRGEGGSGGTAIPSFSLDFSRGTVVDQRFGIISPTFTRATTKTQTDHEGRPSTALSGEVVFEGLRRVRNLLATQTVAPNNGNTVVTAGQVDPFGGTNAYKVVHSTAAPGDFSQINNTAAFPAGGGLASVWLRGEVGGEQVTVSNGLGGLMAVVLTTAWQRYAYAHGAAGPWGTAIYATAGTPTIYRALHQVEDTASQSNRAPSEFVDGATIYGAKVAGVRYFTWLNGNTITGSLVTGAIVTEATGASIPSRTGLGLGWIPAADTTSSFSTPDTAGSSPSTEGEFIFLLAPQDWTPAVGRYVMGQATAHYLLLNPTGTLTLADFGNFTSSVAVSAGGAVDGCHLWIKVTFKSDNGTGNSEVKFFTAPFAGNLITPPSNFTQLGTTVTGAVNTFGSSAAAWTFGNYNSLASLGGMIQYGSIAIAIGGTPGIVFRAGDWVSGGSFNSGVTGETWTLNGGARVFKWPNGYYPETASTNLVLHSENFAGASWTGLGTPTRVAAALRCGGIFLDLIGDDDAGALEAYSQVITTTGDAIKAVSFFFAQGTSASSVIQWRDTTAPATRLLAAITWTNGIPTVTMTTGTLIRVAPHTNGVWRVEMLTTSVTAANTNQIECYPATLAALGAAQTGNIYWGGVMAENTVATTARASSYIATAGATVTRNSDVMVVSTLGAWFNASAGTLVSHFVPNAVAANRWLASFNDTTANERHDLLCSSGNEGRFASADGGVIQADVTSVTVPTTAFTVGGVAAAYALNDFAVSGNGAAVTTDASGTLPTSTQFEIGSARGTGFFEGLICDLNYYPSRVPNATLQVRSAA